MTRFMKTTMLATLVALGVTSASQAGYYHEPHYKTVTTYVTKKVHYTVAVTRYDHCGTPYCVYENRCKYVEVPVVSRVACY